MRRREFLGVVGGAAAWPCVAASQGQPKRPLVGLLAPGARTTGAPFYSAFLDGMRSLGYLEGRDYVYEEHYADNDLARLPLLAKELVRQSPDVIVAGTLAATLAAKEATADIAIVGVNLSEPVEMGLALSEARPGKNVTGTLIRLKGLAGKQLEIAHDFLPASKKIGVLANPDNPATASQLQEVKLAASKLGVELAVVEAHTIADFRPAFEAFVREHAMPILVLSDVLFGNARRQIAAFALAKHLPSVYTYREHVDDGGLISYGISLRANYRRAAYFVDRILKGTKPADLPIEFPTRVELVINLATAKALGIEIPAALLARADEVIE